MPSEGLADQNKNKLEPDSFKDELSDDILNGDAEEILEQPEDNEIDIDDLKL